MPLVAWIYADKFRQELEGRSSSIYSHWSSLSCADPSNVKGRPLVEMRAGQLDCDDRERRRLERQFLGNTPLKIRIIEKFRKRRQDSIKIVWFVQSRIDDIAGFQLLLRRAEESNTTYLVNETIVYTKRDYIISSLPLDVKYTLCIFPIDSTRTTVANFREYCVTFINAHTDIIFDDHRDEVETAAAATNDIVSKHHHHHQLNRSTVPFSLESQSLMLFLFLLFNLVLHLS